MNTQANALRESSVESSATAAAAIPVSRRIYWAVRRELWENRSIFIAPLAVGGLTLLGSLISMVHLPARMHAAMSLDPVKQREFIMGHYFIVSGVMMLTTLVVGIFYCLDGLYGERRDRSILFWKSLPVSDFETVLSKMITPVLILPLVTFGVAVIVQGIMLLVSSAVLAGSGEGVSLLWTHAAVLQTWPMLFYHLLTVHGLWYAPVYAWLLLVSAWARRAPFLWAFLPPLAIVAVEKIAFNTSHLWDVLANRVIGGPGGEDYMANSLSMDPLMHFKPGLFFISPGLWIGLAVAAAFLALAVRVRRRGGPI